MTEEWGTGRRAEAEAWRALGSSAEGEEVVVGPTSDVRTGLTGFINWSLDVTSSVDNTREEREAAGESRGILDSTPAFAWLTEAGLEGDVGRGWVEPAWACAAR